MSEPMDVYTKKVWVPVLGCTAMMITIFASAIVALRTGSILAWFVVAGAVFVLFGLGLRLYYIMKGLEVK